jgi:hypothetical protein
VVFNQGAGGSLVRTTLLRNTTGVELSRSEAVHLEDVTVAESVGDGLVLTGDRGTTMTGIRAVDNGGNGVVVAEESTDRPVTGITTTRNGGYGVVVIAQTGIRLAGIATTNDRAGGLRINRSTDLHVTDFTATDQPTGVFMHVNTSRVVLDHVRTTGGRRGIAAEKTTAGLEIHDSAIEGARVTGVAIGGKDTLLNGVEVSDSRAGVRVERGAVGVRLAGLVLNGGRDGVVATPGTVGVVIADLVANYVEADAVRSASPNAEIIGGRITGGATGIDVAAGTTISGVAIYAAEEGIHSRSPDLVRAEEVTIDALERVAGKPVPAHRVQRARARSAARADPPAGHERPEPAAPQPARRDRRAADPPGHRARADARRPAAALRRPRAPDAAASGRRGRLINPDHRGGT